MNAKNAETSSYYKYEDLKSFNSDIRTKTGLYY